MKNCAACGSPIHTSTWSCAACGFTPETIDGFVAFAPELAAATDGYREESVDLLDAIQHKSFWFRARNRLITDLISRISPPPESILEVGCGSGYVLNALQASFPSAVLSGSEIYSNGLGYTRDRVGPAVSLMQMDARAIPFDSEFDLVGAFDVIEHIEEDTEVLKQMHRAVKPGGHVLISVPQHPFLWSDADDYACHKRRYRTNELSSKIRAAGFDLVIDTSFVTSPFPAMVAQRLIVGRGKKYEVGSELQLSRWLDRILEILLDAERKAIGMGISFPFGGSRVVMGRRPTG